MDKENFPKSKKDETTSVDSPPVNSDLLVGSIIIILIVLFSIFAGGYLIKSYFQKPSSEISEGLPITTNIDDNLTEDSNFSQNNFNDVPPVYTGDNNNSNDNNNTSNNPDQNTTDEDEEEEEEEDDEDDDSGSSSGSTTPPTPTDACANLGAVTFSQAAGTFNESLDLILSYTGNSQCTTKTIHYTVDNTDPTLLSTTYNNPIHLSSTRTIKTAVFATTQSNQQVRGEVVSKTYNILVPENVVDAPYPDNDTGIYYNDIYVTLSTDTPETIIRYTLDGSDPSNSPLIYATPILVSTTQTIKARATYTGYGTSDLMIKTYTMNVSNPTANIQSGTAVSSGTVITLSTATTGGSYIRYKTDGQSPSCDNGTLGNSITITGTTTIKAIACKAGYNSSDVVTFNYTILPPNTVATPTALPPAGTYTTTQNVTLNCATDGSTIKYTLDGTEPSTSSTAITYTNPINISSTKTIKARGFKSGWTQSELLNATYTITGTVSTPVISPNPDLSNYNKVITITSQSGATIRYTLDGTDPTTSSAQYPAGGITLNQTSTVTIKAKAYLSGWNPSAIASQAYPILTVTTPIANPDGGTYTSTQSVQLSVSNPSDATKRYTTDGATPTCSTGTVYSSAITISTSTTLKAIACKDNYVPSNVMTEEYIIDISEPPEEGSWLWAKRFGGTSIEDLADVTVDSQGNSYITGYFLGTTTFDTTTFVSSGSYDIFVAKLDASGNLLWAKKAGGSGSDVGNAIVVGNDGSIYITGSFSSSPATFGNLSISSTGTANDVFVAKMNSSGDWLWVKKAGNRYIDNGINLAVDSSNNIYVTGSFLYYASFEGLTFDGPYPDYLYSYGQSDAFVAKMNSSGTWLWAKKAGGIYNENGRGIVLDSQNNIYVTGSFTSPEATFDINISNNGGNSQSTDIFVAKLDNSGNWLWSINAGGTGVDVPYNISRDGSNIFITGTYQTTASFGGTSLESDGGYNIFVSKLNSSGDWQWAKSAGGTTDDFAWGITTDNSLVYVTGEFRGIAAFGETNLTNQSTTTSDVFTGVLDSSNGNWISAESFGNISNDIGKGVAVNSVGNTYWAGNFFESIVFGNTTLNSNSGSQDIYIAKRG